ncbi:MAG: leucine-rich repeat domain-containing protein, partial [Clostridia bacterium]|nr:leucine-rich repeat domain-containing protein [Clostridia bacterium]
MKKKDNKLIIALAAAIVVAAAVLVVGLLRQNAPKLAPEGSSASSLYSIQTPTVETGAANTDAWVDLSSIAGDLATAPVVTSSDTTVAVIPPNGSTTAPVLPVSVVTSFVYITTATEPTQPTQPTQPISVPAFPIDPVPTTAEDEFSMSQFDYSVDTMQRTVKLNKFLGNEEFVEIPKKLAGYDVTSIGPACFKGSNVSRVYIYPNIISIGDEAFRDCKNLSYVMFMGDGTGKLDYIGEAAFRGCSALTTINLPATDSIGTFAFGDCSALPSIILKSGTKSIGDFCFSKCSSMTKVTVPKSVTYIGVQSLPAINNGLVLKCAEQSDADDYAGQYNIKTEYYD